MTVNLESVFICGMLSGIAVFQGCDSDALLFGCLVSGEFLVVWYRHEDLGLCLSLPPLVCCFPPPDLCRKLAIHSHNLAMLN